MVLQHVAQCAGAFVVIGAGGDADILGHGDLHVVDEVAVPQRLNQGIGEAEHQQVLHGFLAKIVVDAEHLLLVEMLMQDAIQQTGALDILAERLFDDDAMMAARLVQPGLVQPADDGAEIGRLDRKVEYGIGADVLTAGSLGQALVELRIVQFTGEVTEPPGKALVNLLVEVLADRLAYRLQQTFLPLFVGPGPPPERDDRHLRRQVPGNVQLIQGGHQFDLGQVARGAKDHEMARSDLPGF